MPAYQKSFDKYVIQYYSNFANVIAWITCYSGNVIVGRIGFVKDETAIPQNYVSGGEKLIIFYSSSRFANIYEILRNEKPLYLWLSDTGTGFVGTSELEEIGELEPPA